MKAFWLALLLLIFQFGTSAQKLHTTTRSLFSPELPAQLQQQLSWLSYWQAQHKSRNAHKQTFIEGRAIGGSENELKHYFWPGRYQICTYLTPDTTLRTEITPLYTSNIPDSLIVSVNLKDITERAVENIIVTEDGVVLDSVWLAMHDYFGTWSSSDVDPYQANPRDLPDTLVLQLADDAAGKTWSPPLDTAIVNSTFGFRRWRRHNGIDLDLETGDLVRSAFSGVVRLSRYNRRGFGNYILVRHENGLETIYAHLKESFVRPGMYVEAGQIIGAGGTTGRSTGPHLHFEVRYKGFPIDPAEVFDFKSNALHDETFVWDARHLKRTGYSGRGTRRKAAVVKKNASGSRVYKVRSGDSLWTIARHYGTSIARLCALNGISRSTTLQIGQRIVLD